MLENIKKLPEPQKRRFAIILALILTIIISGGWFFYKGLTAEKSATGGSDFSIISAMFQNIGDAWASAKDRVVASTSEALAELQTLASTSATTTAATTTATSAKIK